MNDVRVNYYTAKLAVEHKVKKTQVFRTLREAASMVGTAMMDIETGMIQNGCFENERWKVYLISSKW